MKNNRIIKWIVKYFKMSFGLAKEEEEFKYATPDSISETLPDSIEDCNIGTYETRCSEIDANKKNMLLMDDAMMQFGLHALDFNKIKRNYHCDVDDKFNVYMCKGRYAGFIAHDLILNLEYLDVAILDLTLETRVKLKNGNIYSYDGIDIAVLIKSKFPKCRFKFFTSHNMNHRDESIIYYVEKYKQLLGGNIMAKVISKSDNRVKHLRSLMECPDVKQE